ncbi:hypothetical protein Tco_0534421 [Tanacetum coccineum]
MESVAPVMSSFKYAVYVSDIMCIVRSLNHEVALPNFPLVFCLLLSQIVNPPILHDQFASSRGPILQWSLASSHNTESIESGIPPKYLFIVVSLFREKLVTYSNATPEIVGVATTSCLVLVGSTTLPQSLDFIPLDNYLVCHLLLQSDHVMAYATSLGTVLAYEIPPW